VTRSTRTSPSNFVAEPRESWDRSGTSMVFLRIKRLEVLSLVGGRSERSGDRYSRSIKRDRSRRSASFVNCFAVPDANASPCQRQTSELRWRQTDRAPPCHSPEVPLSDQLRLEFPSSHASWRMKRHKRLFGQSSPRPIAVRHCSCPA